MATGFFASLNAMVVAQESIDNQLSITLDDSLANQLADQVPSQRYAWTLSWSGESYTVYPVILPNEVRVNFVNSEGTIAVSFNNRNSWQVDVVYGLLPEGLTVGINYSTGTLNYANAAQQVLFSHFCSDFVNSQLGTDTIRVQSCEDSNGEGYENQIRVNSEGQITQLHYMIHEDYPMITLTPNNLDFSDNN